MAEAAKKVRTAVKGRFTRSINHLKAAIEEEEGIEELQMLLADVTECRDRMVEKHEIYLLEEDAVEDDWLREPEDQYVDIRRLVKKTEKNLNENSTLRKLKGLAEYSANTFLLVIKRIDVAMSSGCSKSLVELEKANLYEKFEGLKIKYEELNSLDENATTKLVDYENSFLQCILRIDKYILSLEAIQIEKSKSGFKRNKIPLPTFSGNMREYYGFKKDFNDLVLPNIAEVEAAFTLRQCLMESVREYVSTCEDDITEIFKRLDGKYGDSSKIMEMIIYEIKSFPKINDIEDKSLIAFVHIIEKGQRDLLKLKLESVITNPYIVSTIESKLPKDLSLEWFRKVKKPGSGITIENKFKKLLEFIQTLRDALEYGESNIRKSDESKRRVNESSSWKSDGDHRQKDKPACWIHPSLKNHSVSECFTFASKTNQQKVELVRENAACWSCLALGHIGKNCAKKTMCKVDDCKSYHHPLLHAAHVEGVVFHNEIMQGQNATINPCLLLIMQAPAKCENENKVIDVNVMWDSASTISLITHDAAEQLGLKGERVSLTIIKAGGSIENILSKKYKMELADKSGCLVEFVVYGLPKISTDIRTVEIDSVIAVFPDVSKSEISQPKGQVDVLVGLDYAAFHPQMLMHSNHLVLYQNRFGLCIGGTHTNMSKSTERVIDYVQINHLQANILNDFLGVESMELYEKGSWNEHDFTLKERRELKLIEQGLRYTGECWEAALPWLKDPRKLPNNRFVALSILKSTEKRISRDKVVLKAYKNEMDDMLARGVARKLTELELAEYKGPIHYITHHEVMKPDSESTPLRIVFNTSLTYHSHKLNDYWAKGPDIVNNMWGVFLRFREEEVAFVGDISKMYHTVKMPEPVDQNTHRFLWRNVEMQREPSTYVMTRISFGDRPAGTIVNLALQKTAEMNQHEYPVACKTILRNAYVDDILDSCKVEDDVKTVTAEIEEVIGKGNFKVKGWLISTYDESDREVSHHTKETHPIKEIQIDMGNKTFPNQPSEEGSVDAKAQKVLGMKWNYEKDIFFFTVKLNFSPKRKNVRVGPNINRYEFPLGVPERLTKRMILQQVNGFYDVFGFATPFILKAKILIRKLWIGENKCLDWDDPITENQRQNWIDFFQELFFMEDIVFPRCMKPIDIVNEDPVLVIFCDGSEDAYGAVAYVRWKSIDGTYCSQLLASRSKLSPMKKSTIVRIELNGAVLAKRLKDCIVQECRYVFRKIYFITDSEIVFAMIQKDSYGFKTYVGVRVAEIQKGTNTQDWYSVSGKLNIADLTTRGQSPTSLGLGSLWQNGPLFLKEEERNWPLHQNSKVLEIPEVIQTVMCISQVSDVELLDIDRFSKYLRLIRTTCRVLSMINKPYSLKNIFQDPNPIEYKKAITYWVKQCQGQFTDYTIKEKYMRLSPKKLEDGTWVVGSRAEKWVEASYNNETQILLPFNHRFSRLYVEYIHNISHPGVLSTVSKVRLKYWIVSLSKMAKSIIHHCVPCKVKRLENMKQIMAPLPVERLKPAPAWYSISLDYFGPFSVKGDINKRSQGKCFGILFNCLITRALHVDVTRDYSTNSFLMAFRRFVSLRGYPNTVFSDNGSQLKSANRELKSVLKDVDWETVVAFGAENGITWKFTSADAPWQNGCAEALVKSVKRSLCQAIGKQVLSYSELQTVMFETANIINERPIGAHPMSPDEGKYLCPNDMLLGRASSRIPQGPFREHTSTKDRYAFLQSIVDAVWKKMIRLYFPSLIVRQKWHTLRRNVRKGDIVMIQDNNCLRGQWKIGIVDKPEVGSDGAVRNCVVKYKNVRADGSVPKTFTKVTRPVQRIALLVPNEDTHVNQVHCSVHKIIVLSPVNEKNDN